LSCKTFLMATSSPVSHNLAWKTTPKLPFPMTLVSEYETSCGLSGPWPGVATTVVTLDPSLPIVRKSSDVSHWFLFETRNKKKCDFDNEIAATIYFFSYMTAELIIDSWGSLLNICLPISVYRSLNNFTQNKHYHYCRARYIMSKGSLSRFISLEWIKFALTKHSLRFIVGNILSLLSFHLHIDPQPFCNVRHRASSYDQRGFRKIVNDV
jgi:hypothetical protein